MGKDLKGKELGEYLSQRKDGRYEAKYTDNFGKRRSIYGKKLSDVKKKLNEALYQKEHNIMSKSVKFTLDEWFDIWLNEYKKKNIKSTTLNRYIRYYKNNVQPFLGFMLIKDVKQIHIQNLFNKCSTELNLSLSSLKHLRALLKNIFDCALYNDYIIKNPVVNIIFSSNKPDKARRVLTENEQKLFFNYAKRYSYYNLYLFLLYTGCRIGEAVALTWDDVDLNKKIIRINKTFGKNYNYESKSCEYYTHTPKTSKSNREIPMHDFLYNLLVDMFKEKNTCNLVFHSKNNTNLLPDDIWCNIQVIINKIGVDSSSIKFERFSPHSLRHTFATNCFNSDIEAKVVQEYMGHTNLKMTMDLYTHVLPERKMSEIKKLKTIV